MAKGPQGSRPARLGRRGREAPGLADGRLPLDRHVEEVDLVMTRPRIRPAGVDQGGMVEVTPARPSTGSSRYDPQPVPRGQIAAGGDERVIFRHNDLPCARFRDLRSSTPRPLTGARSLRPQSTACRGKLRQGGDIGLVRVGRTHSVPARRAVWRHSWTAQGAGDRILPARVARLRAWPRPSAGSKVRSSAQVRAKPSASG